MRSLLDVIELYIFNVPGIREEFAFSFDLSQAADEETQYANFEMLQGAYLIVVAQYFSGNLAAKRRARRQRFMRVLDVGVALLLLILADAVADCKIIEITLGTALTVYFHLRSGCFHRLAT